MHDNQKDGRCDESYSCEDSGALDENDAFHSHSLSPTTGNRGYNTFEGLSDNSVKSRSQSVSLPHVACTSRTVIKRSLSGLESHGSANTRSTRNVNGAADYSIEVSGNSKTDEECPREVYCCGFSKRQLKCGVALCLLSITDVMGFSIFSPFFPVVAKQQMNLSEVQIGLIFAAFSMAGIFASIFTGTLLVRVGPKFIILSGLFLSAGSTICFGILDRSPPEYFFYLCFACRLLMGIGSASTFTALFAVIFQEFSDRALTVIGVSESLCSIGGIIGPLIGGALYDVGGFITPFLFLGGLQFGVFLVSAVLIPPVAVERQVNAVSPAWLLLNPHGLFAALFVVVTLMINSFITANLSLFLVDSFHVSTLMVGVFFLVFSVFYGISTPIWGYIADSKNIGAHMMTGSCLIGGLVLTLIGPADVWMHLFGWTESHKWLVFVTIGAMGSLMGALIMPTFGEMLIAAKQMKLQDNELAEYGLVSGLWNTVFSVGDVLGPTLGGAIVEKTGFSDTCAIFGLVLAVLAVAKAIHLVYLHHKKRNSPPGEDREAERESSDDVEERKNLLGSNYPSVQA